jgi:hypothetical protein
MKRLLSECCLREIKVGCEKEYPCGGRTFCQSFKVERCECCGLETSGVMKEVCDDCGAVTDGECLECHTATANAG